jgi:alkylated DNA repair dioxygenase AlkB
MKAQADFFTGQDLPEGLVYRPTEITPGEERGLVRKFETLPFKPFEFHGYLGNRRIVSYGWHYDYAGGALKESAPVPEFLLQLRQRAGALAGRNAGDFRQAMVTEYAPGVGIGWHRDKPMFEDIVGFSFLSACTLRFRRKQGSGWERRSLAAEPRSVYLLRGPARREWEHSIPAMKSLRYSVTFRSFGAA